MEGGAEQGPVFVCVDVLVAVLAGDVEEDFGDPDQRRTGQGGYCGCVLGGADTAVAVGVGGRLELAPPVGVGGVERVGHRFEHLSAGSSPYRRGRIQYRQRDDPVRAAQGVESSGHLETGTGQSGLDCLRGHWPVGVNEAPPS